MSIERPTPNAEQDPHFQSLDQIVEVINALVDTRTGNCEKPPRIKKEQSGLVTFVEFEIKNLDDGSTSLLLYTLDDQKTANATINITHFQGSPDDGNYLGSNTLAKYDGRSGQWRNPAKVVIKKWLLPPVMEDPSTGQLLIIVPQGAPPIENYGASLTELDAETKRQGQPIVEMVRNMEVEALSTLFDKALTVFGARNMEETLRREVNNLQAALEARNATKPHLNEIYSKMIGLNRSKGQQEPLGAWNPKGDLTEGQFRDFNEKRAHLSNMVGILHKDESGKVAIRHDLN